MSTIECKQINKLTGNRRRELYKWGVRTRQRVPEEISFLIYTLASSGRNRVNFFSIKSSWNQINTFGILQIRLESNQISLFSILRIRLESNQIITFVGFLRWKPNQHFWHETSQLFLVSIKLLFVGSKDYVIGIQFPIGISSYSHFNFKLFEPWMSITIRPLGIFHSTSLFCQKCFKFEQKSEHLSRFFDKCPACFNTVYLTFFIILTFRLVLMICSSDLS